MTTGLLVGFAFGGLSGCMTAQTSRKEAREVARLEAKLRRTEAKLATQRERNLVLQNRIKIVRENGGDDPEINHPLDAFAPGMQLDVPISPTRQNVALVPKRLPEKKRGASARDPRVRSLAEAPETPGEQADRVLARTVRELLKSGNELEAERTAMLLEKSYPDSELVAETRFQQGLYYFRKKNLRQADRLFQTTLMSPKTHVRARAGAVLMRGIIARRLAMDGAKSGQNLKTAQANLELSRKSFEYVRKQFPGSPEAKRASRELRAITAQTDKTMTRIK